MTGGTRAPAHGDGAGANHHDASLLKPTLGRLVSFGPPLEATVQLDRGDESGMPRALQGDVAFAGTIACKRVSAPTQADRSSKRIPG